MSRTSVDVYQNEKLVNGFDYDLQVWVRDGVVCSDVGMNRELYGGMNWENARKKAMEVTK